MHFQLINIGFSNTVLASEVVAVVSPDSAPIRRMVQEARSRQRLSDTTEGRQVRAVIVTTGGAQRRAHSTVQPESNSLTLNPSFAATTVAEMILSAIQPETVAQRLVFDRSARLSQLSSLESLDVMEIKLINIGFGNIVSASRVIAIVSPESAPIKRIITDARDRGQLVDATYGRRTRAVIITDFGHIILSAIQPETVANRFVVSKDGSSSDD